MGDHKLKVSCIEKVMLIVYTHFDWRTSAITPAVKGADALVPVNVVVHLFCGVVETCINTA